MECNSYLFFINNISSLLMISSALIFLVFIAIKIKSLSSGGGGFLVKNSSRVIFLSVIFLVISIFLKYFSEYRVIKSTVNSLLHNNVLVKINGRLAGSDFVEIFGRAIENAVKFKEKGSHPTSRNYFKVYIGDYFFMNYLLRQDSRDLNMYWISASCSNESMDLGYIKLEPNVFENEKSVEIE